MRSRGSEFKCRHGPTFPLKQYHRPHRLNGRVRNGNGCCPVGMGTDKNHHPALTGWRFVLLFDNQYQVLLSVVRCQSSVAFATDNGPRTTDHSSDFAFEFLLASERIDRSSIQKIKHLTVSTGNLKASRLVQLRPINRVVYPGSCGT